MPSLHSSDGSVPQLPGTKWKNHLAGLEQEMSKLLDDIIILTHLVNGFGEYVFTQ